LKIANCKLQNENRHSGLALLLRLAPLLVILFSSLQTRRPRMLPSNFQFSIFNFQFAIPPHAA